MDDTLGWIYYKKDLPSLAVRPLEDSLKKRPDNAEVLYHLGLTYAKLGDKAKARDALEPGAEARPEGRRRRGPAGAGVGFPVECDRGRNGGISVKKEKRVYNSQSSASFELFWR